MQLRKILLIALIVLPFFSFCQKLKVLNEWIYVGSTVDKEKFYIDTKVAESNYPLLKIWTKSERKKMVMNHKVYYNIENRVFLECDCSARRTRVRTSSYYTSTRKLIGYFTDQNSFSDWDDVIPDSMGEVVLNEICSIYGNTP